MFCCVERSPFGSTTAGTSSIIEAKSRESLNTQEKSPILAPASAKWTFSYSDLFTYFPLFSFSILSQHVALISKNKKKKDLDKMEEKDVKSRENLGTW